jgi:hypothetical protein
MVHVTKMSQLEACRRQMIPLLARNQSLSPRSPPWLSFPVNLPLPPPKLLVPPLQTTLPRFVQLAASVPSAGTLPACQTAAAAQRDIPSSPSPSSLLPLD